MNLFSFEQNELEIDKVYFHEVIHLGKSLNNPLKSKLIASP